MKTLVLYASKYGATKIIAEQIGKELGDDVTVRNIKEKKPNLKVYDTVILGGPVYMNTMNRKLKSYIKAHEKELGKKELGFFIGCYTVPGTEGYLEQFFPKELLDKAKTKGILGGLMQYDKMNAFYRTVFKSLKKIDGFNREFKEPVIQTEEIKKFVEHMKQ